MLLAPSLDLEAEVDNKDMNPSACDTTNDIEPGRTGEWLF